MMYELELQTLKQQTNEEAEMNQHKTCKAFDSIVHPKNVYFSTCDVCIMLVSGFILGFIAAFNI